MCGVYVSCNDEFDYIALSNFDVTWELRYQLHSIFDKDLSTVRGWTFAKFFFEKRKKMSSVDVLRKKSKCFVRKKNLSVRGKKRKFSKCEEGGEKCLSVEFWVFEKKMEENFGEWNFWWKFC